MKACGFLFVAFLGFASSEARATVKLRVSGLPNASQYDSESNARRKVMERFQELHPEIELVSAEGISLPNVVSEATTVMMIAGGISPDVLNLNFRSLDTFVRQGLVIPLTDLAASSEEVQRSVEERILPQVRDVVYRYGPDGKKQLYGLPDELLVMGLYFNKELFRWAGLPQRAPRDWSELKEFSRKIQDLGREYHGLFLPAGSNSAWHLMNFVWSAGGEAVEEKKPDEWLATFDSPEAVEAYKFYYQLVEIDRLAFRATSLNGEQREKTGMFFGYAGETVDNPKLYGFGRVPEGPSGRSVSEINARVYAVSSQIKDPAVEQAAWQYILFLTSPEAARLRAAAFVEIGEAERISPKTLRENGYTQFTTTMSQSFDEEYDEALKNGRPEPYGRNCNLVYQEMTYPLDTILLSENIRQAWNRGDQPEVDREISAILKRAVAVTNERMIGYVPPKIMQTRRWIAAIVVATIVGVFGLVFWKLTGMFRNTAMASQPIGSGSWGAWIFLLPALGLIALWHYIPLGRGTVMAFQDYRLVLPSQFNGLDNFASVLFDASFWNSMLATLHFAAYTLTLGFFAPILLAYALHLIPRYKVFYRIVYYLPAIISGTAIFFLWNALFTADGLMNQILRLFGLDAVRAWTQDPKLAMLSCVIPGIWASAGPGCLIYLAAFKTIPKEQFEAAEIDGAGFLATTRHIMFPGIKALIFINFIGAMAAAFHGASNILIMTGGGPNGMTEVMSLKIFFEAFTRLRFGPATAMAWILGSMLVGLTIIQLRRLSRMEFKAAK